MHQKAFSGQSQRRAWFPGNSSQGPVPVRTWGLGVFARGSRFCGVGLLFAALAFAGCAEDKPTVRQTAPLRVRPSKPTFQETPTLENADDRAEDVRRICNRKASTELPRCWSDEVERTNNKQLTVSVKLMITVSPEGKAIDVTVLEPVPAQATLEKCVADAAAGWIYPTGQTASPVQCNFFLRSSS